MATQPKTTPVKAPSATALGERLADRAQILPELTQRQQQLATDRTPSLRAHTEAHLDQLARDRDRITADIAKALNSPSEWASTSMTRRYGRAPKSERLIGFAPNGHRKTTTFVAARRHDGIAAPCVWDGPVNGARFLAYVEQHLPPPCRRVTS